MELLIFCNKDLQKYFKKYSKKKYQKYNDSDIAYITTNEDYEKFDINRSNPKAIWIMVELLWDDVELFQGYGVALDLVLKSKFSKQNPLQITFFTLFPRKYYFDTQKNYLNTFPKSFVHNRLPIRKIENIITSNFSSQHWSFIRKYGFSANGIWDKITHEFSDVINNGDIVNNRIKELLKALKKVDDIFEISQILKSINTKEEYIKNKDELFTAINKKIQTSLITEIPNSDKLIYAWKPRLMIVEDNAKFRDIIEKKFQTGFVTKSFAYAIDAIQELKDKGNEYDCLLSDLELLEKEGFEQPLQGIDVLEYAKMKLPQIVRNVLTSLPKSGIKDLLPDMESKSIHYKSSFGTHFCDIEWNEYVNDLRQTIKSKYKYKNLIGPNTAIWEISTRLGKQGGGLKLYYYNFKVKYPEMFDNFWNEIKEYYNRVIKNNAKFPTEFPSPKTINGFALFDKEDERKDIKVREKLRTLLLHRLFWLSELYIGKPSIIIDVKSSYNNYFEKEYSFLNDSKIATKDFSDYFNTLGFGVKKLSYCYKVKFNIFFPEEINYLAKNKKIKKVDDANTYPNMFILYHKLREIIQKAQNEDFKKENYRLKETSINLNDILDLFKSLANEIKTSLKEGRNEVSLAIYEYRENNESEYELLTSGFKKIIGHAIEKCNPK